MSSTVPTPPTSDTDIVLEVPTRDAESWAQHSGPLSVSAAPDGARNRNVEGRELTGPMQGFGKMWQKTYRVALPGVSVGPAGVIEAWKDHYADFWPEGNRFHAPVAGIKPGEVGLIDADMPGRVTLSTGVMVLYADQTSFTFMTPQGHPFAGWITFSAEDVDGVTVAEVDLLIRAQDPLTEIGMVLGGHRTEDRLWQETLTNLASHFDVVGAVDTTIRCVDRRRQWRRAGNLRHDAALHEAAHLAGGPARASGRSWARLVASAGVALAVTQLVYQAVVGAVIPPLLVFGVLGLLCLGTVRRTVRVGGAIAVLVGLLFLAGGGPFIGPALAHPESAVDFLHASWSVIAALALVVGGVAVLRRREGRPIRLAGGTAVVAAVALVVSVGATMATGDDPVVGVATTLVAQGFVWSDATLTVAPGDVLAVENRDPSRHTFTVEGTSVQIELPAGRTRTQTIQLDAGTYPFVCSVPGHETMVGSLLVE